MVSVAQQLVKTVAAGLDRVVRPPAGVVVLIYHRVGGGSGLSVDLPVAEFDRQMASLAASGRACSLADALVQLDGAAPSGPAPVVVTFDDGTADFAEHALPVLVRHGVPATLYVATDFIESGRSFPDDGAPLSWAALRDCLDSGLVDVGSHTHTHALLDRLDPAAVAGELDRSLELIGERLDHTAHDFAYPKALPPAPVADAEVRRRFRSAALAGTRPNRFGATDPHRLARSPIQTADGMRWWQHKVDGGLGLEDRLRDVRNRRRYAGAVS